jgi:uncharacterized protein (DUF2141 family)
MKHSSLTTSALAIAVASILAAANAAAEPQSESQLPEVVVTARQRAEKIEVRAFNFNASLALVDAATFNYVGRAFGVIS